mmetsp:Transcript_17909/g.42320  ORF Transcript_17909/g.42320 Transcript_17909/m.42320 type:complete len:201 (+) Transcript_17909:1705-2307(+)
MPSPKVAKLSHQAIRRIHWCCGSFPSGSASLARRTRRWTSSVERRSVVPLSGESLRDSLAARRLRSALLAGVSLSLPAPLLCSADFRCRLRAASRTRAFFSWAVRIGTASAAATGVPACELAEFSACAAADADAAGKAAAARATVATLAMVAWYIFASFLVLDMIRSAAPLCNRFEIPSLTRLNIMYARRKMCPFINTLN